jgi:anti-anti-sigma regulatory factor
MSDSTSLGATLQFQRQGETLIAKILEETLRDATVVNRLREEFLAELDSLPAKWVVVDFAQVTFVGSVAFMALLAMRRAPGVERVRLCNLDPKIKGVFEVCKLIPTPQRTDAPFEVSANLAEAVG